MSEESDDKPSAVQGEHFLAGPTLYLRGIEPDDTRSMIAWHPSPYPVPADLALENLEKEVPADAERNDYRLVACRRSDDQPVGSVQFESEDQRTCWLTIYANPVLGVEADAIKTELMQITVPWLLREREMMSVTIEAPESDRGIASGARELGMRTAFRLRESAWHGGARANLVCYEALHPVWLERLGEPPAPEEGPVLREVNAPAAPRWTSETPPNAWVVGERLYLRPIEQADAEEMARWSAREPESFHDTGRHIRSPISHWQWHRNKADESPPSWIRFAIVAKEGDVLIGANGLAFIDWIARTAETESEIVRPDYRGAGYGTEAKHLLLEYGFERIGLHTVYSFVWEFNTRSWQALLKQGYRRAGRLSWTGVKNAEYVGDLAFDLLAEEWRSHRAASR
jgi:RimJ/RimL family protein N-acetyltransferase